MGFSDQDLRAPGEAPLILPDSAAAAFSVLTRRWVPHLLYLLCQGEARFGELAHAVPSLSNRMLTERLRDLEIEGLIVRTVDAGPPTRITYQISELGAGLRSTLESADLWGTRLPQTSPDP